MLGVFLDVGEEHAAMGRLTERFQDVQHKGENADVTDLDPVLLMPGEGEKKGKRREEEEEGEEEEEEEEKEEVEE